RGYESRTRVFEPRGYVSGSGGVRMRVRGPEPSRIGYANVSAIPRPSAANNMALERARNVSIRSNVRPPPQGGGNNFGRTVTPTHPPIDANRNPPNPQGHIEQRPNPNVGRPDPQGVHGGVPDRPQTVQHVEQQQQHQQVQPVPT